MSLAGRFLYMAGRVMSTPGRVGSFTPAAIQPVANETTGPFQTSPTRRPSGHTTYGDVALMVWSEEDLEAFLAELRGSGVREFLSVYGWDGDDIGDQVDMVNLLKIAAQPKTEPAMVTQYEVTGTPDPDGVLHGHSLHAMEEEAGDGDTEGTPVDNGFAAAAVNITSSSVANPSVVTTATAHGLQTGDTVVIAGHTSVTPDINGSHVVTVTGATTFTIAVNVTDGGTGGTVRRTSTRGGGTADLHVNGLALDGGDGVQIDVIDSPDGATWATLDSFTEITTEVDAADEADGTDERISWTGNTDRYLGVAWAFAGSPGGSEAVTFAAFAARTEQ